MFDIEENLKKLPDCPGVYLHKDKLGQVIYVGKAVSLKNRVRQYFQSSKKLHPKVRALVENIAEFEYITTVTEMEALILECTLIKKHMPKYNVLLRDDKTYPYIKITIGEPYPRLVKTRQIKKGKDRYFGPYSDAGAVNQIVDLLNDIFVLKRCKNISFPKNFRPCLNYHINKCRGMCAENVDRHKYMESVQGVMAFLGGKSKSLMHSLEEKMKTASENLEFEDAAKYRDQLEAVRVISEKQRVAKPGLKDLDIVLPVSTLQKDYGVLFTVRDGKLAGRESYVMEGAGEKKELVAEFIKQHYSESPNVPYEILLGEDIDETELLEEYLSSLAERKVKIYVPKRGEKLALLKLAQKDTVEMVKTIDSREKNKAERWGSIRSEFDKILSDMGYEEVVGMGDLEISAVGVGKGSGSETYRLEAYDISNTGGIDSVAGMVVFEGLNPVRKSFRRFKIKTIAGADDYGSIREVLYRRLRRAAEGDAAFLPLPHIILVDGGKGQVSAARQILAALAVDLPVVGMAKDDRHRTRALVYVPEGEEDCVELELKDKALLFQYVGMIQEEVHRFAIDYHRGIRGKKLQGSVLDEIEGIGSKRKTELFKAFGSIENIKNAGLEELMAVEGMNEKAAKAVLEFFAGL